MPTEKPRFTLTIDEETYQAIQDYQFENRMKSQTQAVLSLIKIGMDKLSKTEKPAKEGELSEMDAEIIELLRSIPTESMQLASDLVKSILTALLHNLQDARGRVSAARQKSIH